VIITKQTATDHEQLTKKTDNWQSAAEHHMQLTARRAVPDILSPAFV